MYGDLPKGEETPGRLMEMALDEESTLAQMFRAQRLRIFCDPGEERFAAEIQCPTHDGTLQWGVLPLGIIHPAALLQVYQSMFGALVNAVAANTLVISVSPVSPFASD